MKYLILALCFGFTLGLEFDRPCRSDVPAKENFSPAFYTGIWFELYNSLEQGFAECIDHHYTRRGLQQVFDVDRTGVLNGNRVRETAIVRVAFPDESPMRAILNGTINRINGEVIEYNYRIYATDYTNYAIVWSCTELENNRSREEGSVIGRQTQLTPAVYSKVDALLEEIGLNREDFRFIDHTPEACGLTGL
ncbi:apolipoprotein D-like [Chironomus tepperi]|uniref:apolipoprotein D-like n=1 Tax=Chironomus tepperi TaxID=113505 RepID=UPI00391EEEA6